VNDRSFYAFDGWQSLSICGGIPSTRQNETPDGWQSASGVWQNYFLG
jgi:hypothetical protein